MYFDRRVENEYHKKFDRHHINSSNDHGIHESCFCQQELHLTSENDKIPIVEQKNYDVLSIKTSAVYLGDDEAGKVYAFSTIVEWKKRLLLQKQIQSEAMYRMQPLHLIADRLWYVEGKKT